MACSHRLSTGFFNFLNDNRTAVKHTQVRTDESVEETLEINDKHAACESTVIISYVFIHCRGGTAPVKLITELF
jgi:hypothetical protein